MSKHAQTERTTEESTHSIADVQADDVEDDFVADEHVEDAESSDAEAEGHPAGGARGIRVKRAVALKVLPVLALMLALAAGYLKYQDFRARDSQRADLDSVRAAMDGTVAMLSYRPDTVEKDVSAAMNRLTGTMRDSYSSLAHSQVIPSAMQKQITAVATVPAAASVSATENHAVVLVFVDQTATVGNGPPTNTVGSARVTLDKIDGRWLISQFDRV